MFQARPFLAAAAAIVAAGAVSSAAPAPARTGAAGGLAWRVPAHWTDGAGSAMRVATYAVPAAKGAQPGECAVFFFGAGQGEASTRTSSAGGGSSRERRPPSVRP